MKADFLEVVNAGYVGKGEMLNLGVGWLDGNVVKDAKVSIPLATLNRHGLVAGATGTGKTKTLQKMCEMLSENGVPTLVMDIKGDFSGISQAGEMNDKIKSRIDQTGCDWKSDSYPVEFLTLAGGEGVKMRATVGEFGPILFSKMLELNDTQSSVMSLVFKYCDDMGLPILDLTDIKEVLKYIQTEEGKDEIQKEFGAVSSATIGIILRKIIEQEEQGADMFFGEPSFDVEDLLQTRNGKGVVNVMRVSNLQSKPKLFSTFMLSLLSEVYEKFEELGDVEKPKLVIFIDEAHLIFEDASNALMSQMEQVIKLIRSKGVGIIFCTQNPIDIPYSILAQLGLKIQHALRAFTAKDRDAIKKASENYPETDFYKVDKVITELGIGEAFITGLSERGTPTPLVYTIVNPPQSRMDTITEQELKHVLNSSKLISKYNTDINRDSAQEMLCKKMESCNEDNAENKSVRERGAKSVAAGGALGVAIEISKNPLVRQVARTATSAAIRGIFGMLIKK